MTSFFTSLWRLPNTAEPPILLTWASIKFAGGPAACSVAVAGNPQAVATPSAPNTGFDLIKANPNVAAAGIVIAASGLILAGRKLSSARR